jgi:hypothetical protein
MMPPASWLSDRDDPRVVAALKRRCPSCNAQPSERCTLRSPMRGCCGATPADECNSRIPTPTGIVHQIRVPKRLLFREAS